MFEHEAWADRAFPAAAERHGLEGRERHQAQRLAFGAVQRRGTTDHFTEKLGRKPETLDPPVRAALRLGLFELLYSESAEHAIVDGAVELAKAGMRRGGPRRSAGAGGLVNAVLRRAAAEREELLASLGDETPAEAALAHSVPAWLAGMWWEELGGESARSLLTALNEPPETAMRVNTLRCEPDELRRELEAAGEAIAPAGRGPLWAPETLVWEGPLGAAAIAALDEGRMFAQSRGAQSVVASLDPKPGERVLDLCAGPGLKTVAIAARMAGQGEVVAVERAPGRARQITELAARADARNVRVETGDAASFDARDGGYDRVLVDPPCSDLGTLASRPDARWRKDPAAIERLAGLQTGILDRGISALADGGALVYSTCTISRRENSDVVGAALASHTEVEAAERFETRPDRDGTDGFFVVKLARSGPR